MSSNMTARPTPLIYYPYGRTTMANRVMFVMDENTSNDGLHGLRRRLGVRRSERYIYSTAWGASFLNVILTGSFPSITTATDTAMLRVVMAAVEGMCFLFSTLLTHLLTVILFTEWVPFFIPSPHPPLPFIHRSVAQFVLPIVGSLLL